MPGRLNAFTAGLLSSRVESSARNGNLEVSVYFLKAKQGHTVRKIEGNKWI
jgi:hypothetical protein